MLQVKRNVNGNWLGASFHHRFIPTGLGRLVRISSAFHCALLHRLSTLTLRCRPLSRALINFAGGR